MSPQFFLAAALLAGASAAVAQQAATPAARAPAHVERGDLVFEGIPPPDAALNARLDGYLQSREATFLDWLPDGAMLIATRFGDTLQVHRVATPLGAREQLTFYRDPISWVRAARSGGRFAFLKDDGGDENAQVYVEAPNGSVRQMTHGDFIHGSPVWAHDGKRIAFYGNELDGASNDVYVADATSGAAPQLVVGGRHDTWYPLGWSPDDSKLLVWRYVSLEESYLYIADVASGTLTHRQVRPRRTRGLFPHR
jgi:Tol biopolymer transport system component